MTQSGSAVRRHQHILVPPERGIHALANAVTPHLEGVVTALGLGGMFIRTKGLVPCGATLNVKLSHALGAGNGLRGAGCRRDGFRRRICRAYAGERVAMERAFVVSQVPTVTNGCVTLGHKGSASQASLRNFRLWPGLN